MTTAEICGYKNITPWSITWCCGQTFLFHNQSQQDKKYGLVSIFRIHKTNHYEYNKFYLFVHIITEIDDILIRSLANTLTKILNLMVKILI